MEAALGRRRPDALELLGLLWLAAAAGVLALGAVMLPVTAALAVFGAAAVLVFLARTDLAIVLVVAVAPIEGAFSSTAGSGISVTKLTGGLCIASFALSLVRQRRTLVFERGQAIVLGILALALVSTLQAHDTSTAMMTTTRYASFALVYLIVTQYGHDRVLQRRIAWALVVSCSVAAYLGLTSTWRRRRTSRRCPT